MSVEERPHLDPRTVALALGGEARGQQVSAPAPGHSRRDRSLSIMIDDDAPGGFVVHGFAGEEAIALKDYVREKIGLAQWQPSGPPKEPPRSLEPVRAVKTYVYEAADGSPFLRVVRMSDKSFRQARWGGTSWLPGKPDAPKIPYRLPQLLAADADEPVFIVEGEKDVDRLAEAGLVSTTNSEGAGKWTSDLTPWLAGRQVFIIPDNDDVGRAHAAGIKAQIPDATILTLSGLKPKGDVSDWMDAGNSAQDLMGFALAPAPNGLTIGDLAPTPFRWVDAHLLPRRQWLYGRHLIRKYVSTTIAPGGLGKSSLVIVEALAMASGQELLGESVPRPLNVWYWNGEDGQDENRYRTVAAASHHNIHPRQFSERLWQDTGREKELVIATTGMRRTYEVNGALVAELIAHIQANHIDVLIIDPFVAAHEVGENDNGAINAVVRALGRIAEFGNCAIELVHHIRKPGAGITADTDVNDARGASALIGGVRSARVLNVMSEEDAEQYGIANRLAYFHVANGKANLAPRSDVAVWRRIVSFDLHNHEDENDPDSDSIGVVEKWEPPGIFAGLPSGAANLVREIISAGDFRYDFRSPDWAGYALAQTCAADPTCADGRKKLCKLIDKWIENGVFRKIIERDNQRKTMAFVRADPPDIRQTDDDCAGPFD